MRPLRQGLQIAPSAQHIEKDIPRDDRFRHLKKHDVAALPSEQGVGADLCQPG